VTVASRAVGRPSTLLVCAGDPSGDALAARAVEAWLRLRPDGRLVGLGGPALTAAGLRPLGGSPLVWPFPSPTGVVEPLRVVPALLANAAAFVARARRPDVAGALLVDLPDVNLPLGRLLRLAGVRVVQAVAPQTWAWRSGRNRLLRASCDALGVILPFEESYFRARGCPARFVGHPLVDHLGPLQPPPVPPPCRPLRLALLPGSRPERVRQVLPPLLAGAAELARRGALEHVVVSRAAAIAPALVERLVQRAGVPVPVRLESRPPLEWLVSGGPDGAPPQQVWVAAGTGSLEVAALGIPACVAWRTNRIGFAVARRLVHGRFAGLPNRLLEREALPERLQDELTAERLAGTFEALRRPAAFGRAAAAAGELRARLGGPGFAERLARLVDEVLR
jgi:lipid-A-disaccharide synthase